MRTVTFKTYLASMAALDAGQALADVTADNLAMYAEYLTVALRYAYQWAEWPELQDTQEITPESGLIPWRAAGQAAMGTVYAVTLDDPATTVNPRAAQWRYDTTGQGLRVFGVTGNVFVRHARTSPALTTAAWSNATAYELDDVVYDATTVECYEAIQAGTNHAISDGAYWRKIDLPWIFRAAVPRGAHALRKGAGGQTETEVLLQRSMDAVLAMEIDQFRSRAGQHQPLNVINV